MRTWYVVTQQRTLPSMVPSNQPQGPEDKVHEAELSRSQRLRRTETLFAFWTASDIRFLDARPSASSASSNAQSKPFPVLPSPEMPNTDLNAIKHMGQCKNDSDPSYLALRAVLKEFVKPEQS